jgi:hypothetical protein
MAIQLAINDPDFMERRVILRSNLIVKREMDDQDLIKSKGY